MFERKFDIPFILDEDDIRDYVRVLFKSNREDVSALEKRVDNGHVKIAGWLDEKDSEMDQIRAKLASHEDLVVRLARRLADAERIIESLVDPASGEFVTIVIALPVLTPEDEETFSSSRTDPTPRASFSPAPHHDDSLVAAAAEESMPADEPNPAQATVPVPAEDTMQANVEEMPAKPIMLDMDAMLVDYRSQGEEALPEQEPLPEQERKPVGPVQEPKPVGPVQEPKQVELADKVLSASQPLSADQLKLTEDSMSAETSRPADDSGASLPHKPGEDEMPPPPLPSSTQIEDIPCVQLLPPTPNTSQEAANYATTTLLDVPAQSSSGPSPINTQSRSPSPAPDLRRSPRLVSPSPGLSHKRQASDALVEPAGKKKKKD